MAGSRIANEYQGFVMDVVDDTLLQDLSQRLEDISESAFLERLTRKIKKSAVAIPDSQQFLDGTNHLNDGISYFTGNEYQTIIIELQDHVPCVTIAHEGEDNNRAKKIDKSDELSNNEKFKTKNRFLQEEEIIDLQNDLFEGYGIAISEFETEPLFLSFDPQ